jgi:hypothetical protein
MNHVLTFKSYFSDVGKTFLIQGKSFNFSQKYRHRILYTIVLHKHNYIANR